MNDDTQKLAGCLSIVALIVVAPFVIAAVPVLLGAPVGLVVLFLIGAIISAVFSAIFRR